MECFLLRPTWYFSCNDCQHHVLINSTVVFLFSQIMQRRVKHVKFDTSSSTVTLVMTIWCDYDNPGRKTLKQSHIWVILIKMVTSTSCGDVLACGRWWPTACSHYNRRSILSDPWNNFAILHLETCNIISSYIMKYPVLRTFKAF